MKSHMVYSLRLWGACQLAVALLASVVVTWTSHPHAAGDDLLIYKKNFSRHGNLEVTVPNRLSVPITLDSVEITVSDWKDVSWSEPRLELLPFLDFLAVKIRNDGWADFNGSELDLFASPGEFGDDGISNWGWAKNDTERVRGLLRNKTGIIQLRESVSDYSLYFLPLREDAEPFGFQFQPRTARDSQAIAPFFNLRTSNSHINTENIIYVNVAKTKLYRDSSGRDVEVGGSVAQLLGRIALRDHSNDTQNFFATILQTTPLSEAELYAGVLLNNPLSGGVGGEATFLFGNYSPVAHASTSSTSRYGITVDLRDTPKDPRKLTFPVNRLLRPTTNNVTAPLPSQTPLSITSEALETPVEAEEEMGPMVFDLAFLTDKPSQFQVNISVNWHVGSNSPQSLQRKVAIVKTTFPRTHDVTWKATEEFVSKLIATDPQVVQRCRDILDRKMYPKSAYETDALRDTWTRWLKDAFIVLYSQKQNIDVERVKRFIKWACNGNDVSAFEQSVRDRVSSELLLPFSRIDSVAAVQYVESHCFAPEGATEDQIFAAEAAFFHCLPTILSSDVLLQGLLKSRQALVKRPPFDAKNENDFVPYWSIPELLLACHMALPGVERVLEKEVDARRFGCLAFAAGTTRNDEVRHRLTAIVRGQLKRNDLDDDAATAIFDSARVGGLDTLRVDVGDYLRKKSRDVWAPSAIYAALKYLERFGVREKDAEALRELQDYPSRSEVRQIAKSLLSKIP